MFATVIATNIVKLAVGLTDRIARAVANGTVVGQAQKSAGTEALTVIVATLVGSEADVHELEQHPAFQKMSRSAKAFIEAGVLTPCPHCGAIQGQ